MPKKKLDLTQPEKDFIAKAEKEGFKLEDIQTDGQLRGIIRAYKTSIESLNPNEWNPNKTSQRTDEAISESLATYGQVLECVVRVHPETEGFQIVDGEHRYKEFQGIAKKSMVSVNVLFGYSEADIKKLTLILNETRGRADKIEMAALLGMINEDLPDLSELSLGLPFQEEELSELLSLNDLNWDDFDADFNEEPEEEPKDDGWVTWALRINKDDADIIEQAKALVSDEVKLDKDQAVANGQLLVKLAEDYLAINGSTEASLFETSSV